MQEFKSILASKADKADIQSLYDIKSNKMDVEMSLRAMDIMHKQLKHLSVLQVEQI